MIVLSTEFKKWLSNSFDTQEKAADFLEISRNHYRSITVDGGAVGSEFITSVNEKLGWEFEKAFEIVEDKDGHA